MKAFRRIALIALMFGSVLCAGVAERPADLPKPTTYVNDFAGVIDADLKQQMQDLATQVHEKAKATIEVVTIKTLDGDTIEDFTTQLEDKWKVGAKGTDKGIIILLAMQERKRRIEVGYGLEGILNDAKVGDIGRSVVPQLQQGQYGAALLSEEQQVANVIAADAGVTLENAPPPEHTYHREQVHTQHRFNWVGLIVFIVFMLVIFGRRGGGGGGGGGFLPWFLLGNILGSGRGNYDGGYSGGGGGFGGSSDGGGGGGGSDDFGGGFGGDSGGGGASGDW